ncbi:hypothetical protein [Thalassiella azotivora]
MSTRTTSVSTPTRTRAPRVTRTVAAAAGALCLAAVPAVAQAHPGGDGTSADRGRGHVSTVVERGALTDLRPGTDDPTDGARAGFVAVGVGDRTTAVLTLRGVRAEPGRTLGVHVHVGPCVEGDGAAAGPHYNVDAQTGREPVRVSPRTEVWLDSTIRRGGSSVAVARVPFTVEPGTRSVVVHERPTAEDGSAGERLACLPVEF